MSPGQSGLEAPLPEHQQPPHAWAWPPWVGSECLRPQDPAPSAQTVRLPAWTGGEAVRCLPDLTGPGPRAPALPRTPSRGPTSKVKLDVRRRGPGDQKDPADWGSSSRPVRQAVLQALPGSGGQDQPCWDHPTPFVNLVNCKSNTAVFFMLLVGWIPPGPGLHTAFVPQACLASHPHLPGSSGPGPQGLYKGCNPRTHRLPPQRTGWSGTGR